MDTRKLIFLFRATLDHNQRQQAEEQLAQVSYTTPGHVARNCLNQFFFTTLSLSYLRVEPVDFVNKVTTYPPLYQFPSPKLICGE